MFDGELWLSRKAMSAYILKKNGHGNHSKENDHLLTPRETEILTKIAQGSTNDEIAEELCISRHTVKTHLYNIFKKINVPSRLQAALWAAENL